MNLLSWLTRHPLKKPSGIDRAQYTAEVMAKIKALDSPAPAPAPVRIWLPWPRLAMTLATVAAGMLIMLSVRHQAPTPLPQIAESLAGSEDQWLEETLLLLDELDEDVSSDTAGDGSEDEWFEELDWLDETGLASRS